MKTKKKLTKKQFKELFQKELERTMGVIRGSWEKVVEFSKAQEKGKIWEELE